MRRLRLFSLAFTIGLTTACSQATSPGGVPAPLAATLQRLLADSAAANGVIGIQAAVRIPNVGSWSGVYGMNDSTPMTEDLLISVGSISKMVTAGLALRLVDQGLLSLSDTMGRFFPGLANVGPTISTSLVLSHRSGINDYQSYPNYGSIIFADLQRVWQPAELAALIGTPDFAPNAGFRSSLSNTLLLGMIAEQLMGKPLAQLLQEQLIDPLQLRHTWPGGYGTPPSPVATQWFVDGTGTRTNYTAQFYGPALHSARRGVLMNAGDMARFAEALFTGGLLSPATTTAMETILPDNNGSGIPGATGTGLGIRRFGYLGRTQYGHSGATPESSNFVITDAASGITVAVAINQNGLSHGQMHFRLVPALLEAALAGR